MCGSSAHSHLLLSHTYPMSHQEHPVLFPATAQHYAERAVPCIPPTLCYDKPVVTLSSLPTHCEPVTTCCAANAHTQARGHELSCDHKSTTTKRQRRTESYKGCTTQPGTHQAHWRTACPHFQCALVACAHPTKQSPNPHQALRSQSIQTNHQKAPITRVCTTSLIRPSTRMLG